MAEYIDRKEVYRVLDRLQVRTSTDKTIQNLEYMIDTIEDADVQEVRHGKWEKKQTRSGFEAWFCSECAKGGGYSINPKFNYCPICGTMMDKGENDNGEIC